MSARGFVNQELACAKQMLELARTPAQCRHCAAQILFTFRCFLLELAQLHRLPLDREYSEAHELLSELARSQGQGATIAELEAFSESGWAIPLHAAQKANLSMQNSVKESTPNLNQDLINAVQLADSKGSLSQNDLEIALDFLRSQVVQIRELSQEY